MVEVNTAEQIEVKDSGIAVAYVTSNVEVEKATDLDIRVSKKEYSIVGDDIYIPQLYDDAPQWMKDLVQLVVDVSLESGTTDLVNQLNSTLSAFATSYVPLNQYTQSIVSLQDADTAINSLITTLNSTYNDGISNLSGQVIELQNTKANATEVVAQVISTINSELISPTSNLNATIGSLQQTIANESSARAANFETISSTLETLDGEISGNATAINSINTYVGISNGVPTGTGLLADVEILQKQNDGIIETITGTYDVMLNPQDPNLAELVVTAEPYVTWKAQDTSGIDVRLSHIGDVYIKYNTTSNGAREYVASYKFIRTVVDNTSPYATDTDGFTWALVVDQAAQDAYQQALNAYDLADNKRRVFTTTPSGPVDEGDLWVTGTNPQVVKVYKSGNWELSDTQVDNFISVTYTPTITNLQNQVDGKIESWYTLSTNDPKTAWIDEPTRAKHDGDMWYQTDTKLSYYYSSSTNSWNLIDDAKAIQALADAATAQATADGKISSYYMSTLADANTMSNAWTATEKTNNIGDLVVVWNDSTLDNNGTWRWNGTSWVTTRDKKLVSLASDVTSLSTELTNGTNTWASADSTLENSLRTEITDEGARVESKFAYNSNVNINGIWKKSGFGLTTNYVSGSGTEVDPYVSEFWIDASRFKFTNSNQTGQVAPFTIDATGVTPQITFNGKVSFSNVTDYVEPDIGGAINTNNDIFAQAQGFSDYYDMVSKYSSLGKTIISGGYINTGLVNADSILANSIISSKIDSYAITSKFISASVLSTSRLDLYTDNSLLVFSDYYFIVNSNTNKIPELAVTNGDYTTYNTGIHTGVEPIDENGTVIYYRLPVLPEIEQAVIEFKGKSTTYGDLITGPITASFTIGKYNDGTTNDKLVFRAKNPVILLDTTEARDIDSSYSKYAIYDAFINNSSVSNKHLYTIKIGGVTIISIEGWIVGTNGSYTITTGGVENITTPSSASWNDAISRYYTLYGIKIEVHMVNNRFNVIMKPQQTRLINLVAGTIEIYSNGKTDAIYNNKSIYKLYLPRIVVKNLL